ncbi:MAG TPA: hypothetical protein VD907_04555 [Verrucomicrobiae bacterium]|nr:hypothetical protein [Verrucomicrobiae bacterium]
MARLTVPVIKVNQATPEQAITTFLSRVQQFVQDNGLRAGAEFSVAAQVEEVETSRIIFHLGFSDITRYGVMFAGWRRDKIGRETFGFTVA